MTHPSNRRAVKPRRLQSHAAASLALLLSFSTFAPTPLSRFCKRLLRDGEAAAFDSAPRVRFGCRGLSRSLVKLRLVSLLRFAFARLLLPELAYLSCLFLGAPDVGATDPLERSFSGTRISGLACAIRVRFGV